MQRGMEGLVLHKISDQTVDQLNIRVEADIQICVLNYHKFYLFVSFYFVLRVNICFVWKYADSFVAAEG